MGSESYTRKLSAIFYADVAGYSRLTGADEDGTHRQLSACLDVIAQQIEQYNGRVVHYAGDAVLADFVTVSGAIKCAVSIQETLHTRNEGMPDDRKLRFRIGVHMGEVIIDRDDIYGEGVNIAARLEALADPGGICISESAKSAAGHKLPYTYEFMGTKQVKNIAESIRVYRVVLPELEVTPRPSNDLNSRPSIAVMPFKNMSGDPGQEYFVDGITDEIIVALSRIRWFFVIARHSTFAYKDQPINVIQVAQALGVHYVLEGSVRKSGSRVRVSAQLVNGIEGRNVWARRFDIASDDIFEMQDNLAESIVGALEPQLGMAEQDRARSKRPENLDAWDYYQRGMWHLHNLTSHNLIEARKLFHLAIELDPHLGAAYAGIAESYYFGIVYGYSSMPQQDRREALNAARQAVRLDDQDAGAHCALGRAHYLRREHDQAILELEIALSLNPSLAAAHYGLGAAHLFSGHAQDAFPHLQNAIRLSPIDPNMGSFLVRMADAHLFLESYDEAIKMARKALQQRNFQWSRYAVLLSALGHSGRLYEVDSIYQQLMVKRPDFSIEFVRATHLFNDSNYMEHYLEGLRMAGVE